MPNLISRRQYNDRRKTTSTLCDTIRKRIAEKIDGGCLLYTSVPTPDSSPTNFEIQKLRTMKSTFSVIYYLKRQVVKKDGTVPVMGRITVDGSQTQFSCKLTVDPKLWDTKGKSWLLERFWQWNVHWRINR